MLFVLEVKSEADYQRWLSDTKRAQGIATPSDQASNVSTTGTKSE
jgi:hypothetical protein